MHAKHSIHHKWKIITVTRPVQNPLHLVAFAAGLEKIPVVACTWMHLVHTATINAVCQNRQAAELQGLGFLTSLSDCLE